MTLNQLNLVYFKTDKAGFQEQRFSDFTQTNKIVESTNHQYLGLEGKHGKSKSKVKVKSIRPIPPLPEIHPIQPIQPIQPL